MKKTIVILLMVLTVLCLGSMVSAVPLVNVTYNPYSATFTTTSELNQSESVVRTGLAIKSCNNQTIVNSGNCDYLYWCVAVLPSTSASIGDALNRQCTEITDNPGSISLNSFQPPKGILYYVTTFVVRVNEVYSTTSGSWTPGTTIPNQYVTVHPIRSMCMPGYELYGTSISAPACYLAQRYCLDTSKSGICTNSYNLFVIDLNKDGVINQTDVSSGASWCRDTSGQGICDVTLGISASCVDTCSRYTYDANNIATCTTSGPNGVCDDGDMAILTGCADSTLSPHSGICDTIDTSTCSTNFNPVCSNSTLVNGNIVGGNTWPNDCFAKNKGLALGDGMNTSNTYRAGSCLPPVTQCYVSNDCPLPPASVCGASGFGTITAGCLYNRCAYSGSCPNLACATDADCASMKLPCAGIAPKCDLTANPHVCTATGTCITKPNNPGFDLFNYINSAWTTLWNAIKGILGL